MIKITQTTVTLQPSDLKQKSLNQVLVIIQTHIFLTGDITATGGDANSRLAFKNCTQSTKCITDINDEHVDNADNLDIIMPIYNLIEHSDNYSDTSGSL